MSKVLSNCSIEELENEIVKRNCEERDKLQKRIEELDRKLLNSNNLDNCKGKYEYFGGLKQCIVDSFEIKQVMTLSEIAEFIKKHNVTKSVNVKLAVSQSIAKNRDVIRKVGRGLYEKI